LSVDPPRTRVYVACQRNATLVVVDPTNGRVLSSHPVGDGPDELAFDAVAGRLYVAAESGVLTVFTVDDAGIRELARKSIGPNSHLVSVDPDTHHVYVLLENVGGHPVLREIAVEPAEGA
jgi:DNA-binding beta-propeller fold protein YncE